MKTLSVNIMAEFSVPDDWEVVDHIPDPKFPEDVRRLLKVDGEFYDFFPECLVKVAQKDMVIWSADEGRADEILDCMEAFHVDIQEQKS